MSHIVKLVVCVVCVLKLVINLLYFFFFENGFAGEMSKNDPVRFDMSPATRRREPAVDY